MIEPAKRLKHVEFSATLKSKDTINRLKAEGKQVYAFTVGEPDFDTPKHISEVAINALNSGFTHYTASSGIPELRTAVMEKCNRENKIPATQENVMITPTKFGIYAALQATIDPGDQVLIPDPGWVSYDPMIQMAGGKPILVGTYNEDEFRLLPENVMEALTKKTKIMILNSPSNPTGAVYTKDDIKGLVQIAIDHDIMVISDEVYEKIIYEGEHYSIGSFDNMFERTITVSGFSKAYAMTGWRLGWLIAPKNILDAISKIQQHSISQCTSFAQKGGVAALTGCQDCITEMVNEFKARRDLVITGLNSIDGLSCFKPKGAFYAFFKFDRDISSAEFCDLLLEKSGVVLTAGSAFGPGGEGFARLSYAASREMLQKGLEKIKEFMMG